MPAVNFEVTWPDGECVSYYSPSTVIHEHVAAGDSYTIEEFETRVYGALHLASERVRAKYGFACSAANDEKIKIEDKIRRLQATGTTGNVILNSLT
ncbi:MSMEG_0570 family nitrogen starvation response protein [Leucothrix sargassi]|nr:MSMEG_0570 family nitrogen starvation response protein [Leucothrix sargassi]